MRRNDNYQRGKPLLHVALSPSELAAGLPAFEIDYFPKPLKCTIPVA